MITVGARVTTTNKITVVDDALVLCGDAWEDRICLYQYFSYQYLLYHGIFVPVVHQSDSGLDIVNAFSTGYRV